MATVHDAYNAALSGEGTIVDIREANETSGTHIPGAIALPLSRLLKDSHTLKGRSPLYLICASGGRSTMAADYLESEEHMTCHSVDGGVIAWKDAGLPFGD